jgi:predicted AAA+ superfamily ATPase
MLVDEAFLMLDKKRSKEEALRYMLVFGGVPKYLEQINLNKSFNQNMNLLCFSPHGIMMKEVERIFYNQFRESQTYRKIVMLLKDGIYSLNEIGKKLNIASGGGLRQYLCNLERAELIHSFIPYDRNANTKFKKYTLLDEYLTFYYKYIHANLRAIQETSSNKLFETLTKDSFNSWMGFAFERFCIKHSGFLSGIMGFKDEVILASPYFERNDKRFQIDLLFKRADKVITICEIKHRNKKISTKVIPEMERKCSLIKIPKGYTLEKALISLYGPDRSLKDAGYFNHFIRLDDMF